jgi:hypothetical protein
MSKIPPMNQRVGKVPLGKPRKRNNTCPALHQRIQDLQETKAMRENDRIVIARVQATVDQLRDEWRTMINKNFYDPYEPINLVPTFLLLGIFVCHVVALIRGW